MSEVRQTYTMVREHKRLKRQPTVWANGGRGNMTTLHVPTVIKGEAYEVAVILDNVNDFDERIEEIKKVLAK